MELNYNQEENIGDINYDEEDKCCKTIKINILSKTYKISNKSSNNLNNKFLIMAGYIKYHIINKSVNPINYYWIKISNNEMLCNIIMITINILFLAMFFNCLLVYPEKTE